MRNQAARPHGFTLIELLMTIAILAVLLALGAPAYAKLIGRTHGQTTHNELTTMLNFARLSAVSRHGHVIACPSTDQTNCDRTTQWHHGWIVFADANHDGVHSDDEPILGVAQAQASNVAVVSTAGRLRVDYQADGSASGTNLTLTVCDRAAGAANATALAINNAGRVRSSTPSAEATEACLRAAG